MDPGGCESTSAELTRTDIEKLEESCLCTISRIRLVSVRYAWKQQGLNTSRTTEDIDIGPWASMRLPGQKDIVIMRHNS